MITNGETSIYTIAEIAYLTERYIKRCAIDGCKFLHLPDEEISKMAFDKSNFTSNNMNEADLIDLPPVFKIDTTIETDKEFTREFFIAAIDTFLGRTDRPSQAKRKEIVSDLGKRDMNDRMVVIYIFIILGCDKACATQSKDLISVYTSTDDEISETKKVKDEEKMKNKLQIVIDDKDSVVYLTVVIMNSLRRQKIEFNFYSPIEIKKMYNEVLKIVSVKNTIEFDEFCALTFENMTENTTITFGKNLPELRRYTISGKDFLTMVGSITGQSEGLNKEDESRIENAMMDDSLGESKIGLLADIIDAELKNISSSFYCEDCCNTKEEIAESDTNKVKVRWFDGYIEEFDAVEARSGGEVLWIKLANGEDRWIPLTNVRWFSGLK